MQTIYYENGRPVPTVNSFDSLCTSNSKKSNRNQGVTWRRVLRMMRDLGYVRPFEDADEPSNKGTESKPNEQKEQSKSDEGTESKPEQNKAKATKEEKAEQSKPEKGHIPTAFLQCTSRNEFEARKRANLPAIYFTKPLVKTLIDMDAPSPTEKKKGRVEVVQINVMVWVFAPGVSSNGLWHLSKGTVHHIVFVTEKRRAYEIARVALDLAQRTEHAVMLKIANRLKADIHRKHQRERWERKRSV